MKKDTLFGFIFMFFILMVILSMCSNGTERYGKGSGKCNICGKSATHTFQGYGYCNKHYDGAVKWAIDNPRS